MHLFFKIFAWRISRQVLFTEKHEIETLDFIGFCEILFMLIDWIILEGRSPHRGGRSMFVFMNIIREMLYLEFFLIDLFLSLFHRFVLGQVLGWVILLSEHQVYNGFDNYNNPILWWYQKINSINFKRDDHLVWRLSKVDYVSQN